MQSGPAGEAVDSPFGMLSSRNKLTPSGGGAESSQENAGPRRRTRGISWRWKFRHARGGESGTRKLTWWKMSPSTLRVCSDSLKEIGYGHPMSRLA
jgi:hypothetical protein